MVAKSFVLILETTSIFLQIGRDFRCSAGKIVAKCF